jgi:hypothetical protein
VKMKRLAAAAAPVGVAVLGSGLLAAHPADASPARPAAVPAVGGIDCHGDLCVQTICYDSYYDSFHVNTWANTRGFYGHFEIFTYNGYINGKAYNSPTSVWPAGGMHHTFKGLDAGPNDYQATAWSQAYKGAPYHDIGRASFSASPSNEPAC